PTVDHVGISRRIGNEKERRRLREIVDRLRPPGTGFIVRTVAENVPQEKLEADIRFLLEVWNETIKKNEKRHQPGLMHPDLDLILRATRDLFAQDVERLVIDDREEYERVLQFVTVQDTALRERVLLHDTDEPIFDAYGIEEEIKRATARKVWLKSGGYLIMDQAEALTAIDVNSGRYVGKKSLEETITKINVEAAKEIVYQLRLRNIGGIIICDFIDMEKQQNRDKVFKSLQEALGRDKAKTNVLKISELGLVEMTRKRVRESIGRMLHEDCAYCDGQGFVKTATTVSYEIFRELRRSAGSYKDPTLVISCQAEVASLLLGEEKQELRHLMDRFNKSIQVRTQLDYHREQYDIYARVASGTEHKVASSVEQIEPQRWGNPKRGPSENRLESRGGSDRGSGGDRPAGGGGGGGADRGSRRDRDRGRGRDRQGGGGGGGGGGRPDNNRGGNTARPSQPQGVQQQAAGSGGDEPTSSMADPSDGNVALK
ncbi:MAG: Cytoplasmic axial filament protein CafA, partial [Myxococcaceae bacterium]|nr:Cytoplasmic axial filament protein CafA [Myxococcaceae bacterium]